MSGLRSVLTKVPRTLWWLSGLLALYTVLGFLFVPWIAERQLKGLLDERLSLTAEVEEIYFNPFTLYAQVDGLAVTDANGEVLLQLGSVHTNFEPTRLAWLRLQFIRLVVSDLDLYIERDAGGVDTFTHLVRNWAATAAGSEPEPEPESGEGELIPVVAETVRLINLNFHVRDEVPATPFETSIRLAELAIGNLSTLPDSRGSKSLLLEFEDQARLRLSGDLSLDPPELAGALTLENFALATVSRYLQDTLPMHVGQGRLNASVNYDIRFLEEGISVSLDGIQAGVNDLSAVRDGETEPFFSTILLQATNGSLRYPQNQFNLESLQLDQLQLAVVREANGETDLQRLIAAFTQGGTSGTSVSSGAPGSAAAATDTPAPDNSDASNTGPAAVTDPQAAPAPWDLSLQRLAVTGNRLTFRDDSLPSPVQLGVTLDLELTDLSNQADVTFPLNSRLSLDSGGVLQVVGTLGVLPAVSVTTSVNLEALDLTVLQPYLNEFALVELESALLETQAELAVNTQEPFSYRGNLNLRAVDITDQVGGEDLLSLTDLALEGIHFSLADNSLDISEVLLDSLFARIVVNADGSTNIGRRIRPAATEPDTGSEPSAETGGATAPPMTITVGRIEVQNGASHFTDRNLPIVFNADIRELAGSVEGFATPTTQPLELMLEGNVDEFGLAQLDSAFDPFDLTGQSRIDLQFRNLNMPAMTPYTIKFAGREIDRGNLDVTLSYNIEDGQLAARNQVVLRDLQLGDRVEHPDAMDLPLDMAMALLKDANGVIDLEIPVSGDVNDPQFDLGPAIRRAISNALVNLVSAPFRLLANLVGGDGADLDSIRFQPGRATVTPPEQQVLQQLHAALSQRPQLALEIPRLTSEADRSALQTAVVTERINSRIEQLTDADGSLTERRRMVLESLYGEAGLAPTLQEISLANVVESSTPNPLTGEPIISQQPDIPAYVNDLRNRLIAAEPISEQQLQALAQARLDAVRTYLATQGTLGENQLQSGDVQTAELDDDGWLQMEFDLNSR